MKENPASLHDIAKGHTVPEDEKRLRKEMRDRNERYEWDQHRAGHEKGQDRKFGIPGARYPLHRALADSEGRTLPQDEYPDLEDDVTEEEEF